MRKLLFFSLLLTSYWGLAQNALVLNGAYVRMNGGTSASPIYLVVNQSQTTGIIRPGGGHIHSENQYNLVKWITSTNTGNYIFPFGVAGTATDYIPFEFNKTTNGNANITVSTYSTNAANTPFATPVTSMPQAASSIDRFWDIRSTTTVTANLVFRYRGIENTVATCATDTLKAQFWNNAAGPWSALIGPGNPGVTSGIGTVGSINGQSYFQPTETVWALTTVTISPTVTATSSITCNGANNGSATVTTMGGLGPYTYAWSPSASTTSVATGLTPGTQTVTVTGNNSCSKTLTLNIIQPPATTLSIAQTSVTCSSAGAATITPTGGTPSYTSYVWNPAVSTTNTASGLTAGNYTVTVKDNNGCSTTTVFAANVNTTVPVSTANETGTVTCATTTISLFSGPGAMNYTWTAPAGSSITGGINTQNTTGSGSGVYTVNVSDPANGCSKTATVSVSINTTVPSSTAGVTGVVTCTNTTVSLSSGPSAMNYTWTAPPGSSITGGVNNQNTTGSGGGTYTVNIKDPANGCSKTATVAVTINTTAPTPIISTTGTITCSTNTVSLGSAPSAMNYTWTAPAGSSITGGVNSQSTTAQGAGVYTVNISDPSNGCSKTSTIAANVNTIAPSPTAGISGNVTCGSKTVSLTSGPSAMNYTWTAPAGSSITGGTTNQNTTGQGGGSYTVVVTNPANGCSSSTVVTATTNTTAPSPTITNPTPTITCANSTVTLNGNPAAGVTYTWSGPGVVGSANNQTVNVNASGTYSLFVTNTVNSCTNVISATVSNNTILPTTTPVATQTITCSTPSVQLIGSANPNSCTVVWTGGVCAGANSYTATACSPGTYTYIATNPANGCQSAAQVATVVPNSGVPTATLANTGTITCAATSVQVVSSTTASPVSYTWSGPGIVGATNTGTIDVNQSGVYTLTLTNTFNGCTSIITNSVTADNAPFTPTTASSSTITCSITTSTLNAAVGAGTYTYNWSGPGISGTNTLSAVTATAGGVYTVIATNTGNGCTGTQTVMVNSDTNIPTAVTTSPQSFTLSCLTPSTQITVSSTGGATYSWTAPGTGAILSGGNSATVTISGPGIYSVVATGTNGCSAAVATATMIADANAPSVSLSANTISITCSATAPVVTVTPTGTVSIMSYSWSPSSGISSGSNTTTPTFTTSGTYSCLVTANNGCTTTTFVTVADNTVQPVASGTVSNISCANTNVDINPSYTPGSGLTYNWTGSGITGATNTSSVNVNQSGTYTVTMMDPVNGCTNTVMFTVNGNTITPTVTVTSTSSVGLGCSASTSSITLDASSTPSTGVTYNWNTSANTETISVTSAGVYSVVVMDPTNGCSVTAQYTVVDNTTAPNGTAGTNVSIPCGGLTTTVTLNGNSTDPGVIYSWSGPGIISGSNTANPVVNTAGNYTLTISNPTTGCTSTSTVDVINSVPTASFTPDVLTGFAPLTVNFTNNSVNASTYTWSFGNGSTSTATNTSATYNSAGSFSVILVASSGVCSDTASVVIMVDDGFSITIPNVFTPNGDNANDVFTITSTGVKEITLQIFNRWGQLMFEFNGAKAGWDGMTNTGQQASAGTYFYFVKATGFDGKTYEKQGPVSLFR